MPGSLGDVVDAIGIDATLLLVESLGGTRVYVPGRMTPQHALVRIIGHRRAYALADQFPGETLDLPRCVSAIRAVRDNAIRAAREDGARPKQLALKHGLTERQIYSILAAEEPGESPQQRLL